MKKTQWPELFYNIRHTIVPFSAIVLFVALSTGLFTGIRGTIRSLELSVEASYSRDRLHHFVLAYPYGFDEDFVDSLRDSGTVSEAEGRYETYRSIRSDDDRQMVRIVSLTDSIDRPCCTEGSLPEKAGEIAVNRFWAEENGVKTGDVISFEAGGSNSGFYLSAILAEDLNRLTAVSSLMNELVTDSFTVTALVDSAEFLGTFSDANGMSPASPAPVKTVLFVSEKSFDPEAFCGYSNVVVRSGGLEEIPTNSATYKERSSAIEADISKAAQNYVSEKNTALKAASERMKKALEKITVQSENADSLYSPAISTLDNVRDYCSYIEPRTLNGSFVGINYISNTFKNMQYSLVSLFVVIEVLICFTTVSRLVYDQSVLIGTKKALGFRGSEILNPFLLYSAIALLPGTAAGAIIGRFVVEPISVSGVRASYRFDRVIYYLGIKDVLIFASIQAALMLAASLTAGISISRKKPLDLLTGERADSGGHVLLEKLPFWKRLSLMHKTVIKNCIYDKRRVFSTLVGIIGCTGLVVCALSTYENLSRSFDLTMEKISTYNTTVYFSGTDGSGEKVSALLTDENIPYTRACYTIGTINSASERHPVTGLYAVNDDNFYSFIHLFDKTDGKEKMAENGAWINTAYAKHFGAKVGDDVCFKDPSGQEHVFKIEGIYEYYLINYQIIIPSRLYEAEFGVPYKPNTVLFGEAENVKGSLLKLSDTVFVNDFYRESKTLFESFVGVCRTMVAVYLVLSVVLALLLLLNLFTMFVSEKKKELIILMINGCSVKEAEKYISSDTKFLTVIGIIFGILFGIVMGILSLESFNNDATCFLNRISPLACIIGGVFSAVLTFVMCKIALRKVRQFRLSDIGTM